MYAITYDDLERNSHYLEIKNYLLKTLSREIQRKPEPKVFPRQAFGKKKANKVHWMFLRNFVPLKQCPFYKYLIQIIEIYSLYGIYALYTLKN